MAAPLPSPFIRVLSRLYLNPTNLQAKHAWHQNRLSSEVALPELVDTVVDDVIEAAEGAVAVVADAARDAAIILQSQK